MTERRFVPFDPFEPRPVIPPDLAPGVLVACYDRTHVRVTPWQPMTEEYTATWHAGFAAELPLEVVRVTIWDGADRYGVYPLDEPVTVRGLWDVLTVNLTLFRARR